MLARRKIARTPGIFSASLVSSFCSLPLAIVASTGTAYNKPAKLKSDAYIAVPLTLNGPSIRGVCRPIGDVVAVSVIVGILQHSLGSLRHQFQSVCQTAFRQLYLKSVLALRFRVAQRRLRCFLKNSLRRRLPG